MPKKCIPGVICIENMTLFILVILSISVGYLYYKQFNGNVSQSRRHDTTYVMAPQPRLQSSTVVVDQQNPYIPPLNTIDVRGPVEIPPVPSLVSGIPVNIRTSSANTSYRQIGILTKNVNSGRDSEPLILPLFGRNLLNGRDKWQYYTMANSGGVAFNAKLPISVNGKSCTSEYGCDSISNGDVVYVEGYNDTFRATIYENATMNYIPF